jgi:hypothetical protein
MSESMGDIISERPGDFIGIRTKEAADLLAVVSQDSN